VYERPLALTAVPTPKQIRSILDHTEDRYRFPISLAAATGARRGELCALRWSDVYLDGDHEGCSLHGVPHLHIAGTMQRVEGELRTMPPKTRSGRRGVPLATFAVTLLEQQRSGQFRRRLKFGPGWVTTISSSTVVTVSRWNPTH
jgi:integrase